MKERYFLGIDGGASKTRGLIIAENGRPLAAAHLDARSSIGRRPAPEPLAVLRRTVRELLRQSGLGANDLRHAVIGLNGVDFANEVPGQRKAVARAVSLPGARVTLINDAIIALWGATAGPQGLIIQHGSGFTAAYRRQFGQETLFDHLNVGSIFDIRHGVLTAVARMIDGRMRPTPLKDAVLRRLGVRRQAEFAAAVFRRRIPWVMLMSTPPLVFRAWEKGDPAAADLVRQMIDDYAIAALAMIRLTGSSSPDVCLGGGVIRRAPARFWKLFSQKIRIRYPRVTVQPPALPPEYGACILAAVAAGARPKGTYAAVTKYFPLSNLKNNSFMVSGVEP